MIDQIILNHKITRQIGAGGMAIVYEAEHIQLGTKAALKVMNQNFSENTEIKKRFANEAKLLHSLAHPNIVRLLNYQESDNQLVMLMDYVEGNDLKEYISENPAVKDPAATVPLFCKVLDAMEHAHQKGVIHRDIKPSNIMVDTNGEPVILDFGIAKALGNDQSGDTATAAFMGSRPYMSPEQIKSTKYVDHRTDIYSLGITLYYLLTGKVAYDPTESSELDIIMKIMKEPLPRINHKGLQTVLDKATAKDPSHRYQSCKEFANALSQSEEKIALKSSEETEYILRVEPESHDNKTSKKNKVIFMVMVTAVIAATAIFLLFVNKKSDPASVIAKQGSKDDQIETTVSDPIGQNGISTAENTSPKPNLAEVPKSTPIKNFDTMLSQILDTSSQPNERVKIMAPLGNELAENAVIQILDKNGDLVEKFNKSQFLRYAATRQFVKSHEVLEKKKPQNKIELLVLKINI